MKAGRNAVETLRRCNSTRGQISVASVIPAKAVRPMVPDVLGGFRSPEDDFFIKSIGHWRHALEKPDPGVGARFRRMKPEKRLHEITIHREVVWAITMAATIRY